MSQPTPEELLAYANDNERLADFRRAQADLYDHTAREVVAGVTGETPEFLRLNQAVVDTGKRLPKRMKHLRKGV